MPQNVTERRLKAIIQTVHTFQADCILLNSCEMREIIDKQRLYDQIKLYLTEVHD